LNDKRLRQALSMAWNQELYVRSVFRDTVPVAKYLFPLQTTCKNTGYQEYNLEKAKALVKEIGKPIRLELIHTNTPRGKETGLIAQQFFKKIGVELTLKSLAVPQVFRKLMSRKFQMSGSRLPHYDLMNSTMYLSFHSKGYLNFSNYSNPEVDQWLNLPKMAASETYRNQALCETARQVNEDGVLLFLGGRRFHAIAREEVRGDVDLSDGILQLANIWLQK